VTTSAPLETITIPNLDRDDNDLINRLLTKLRNHNRRNTLRAAHYDGKHACRQIGTVVPPQYYRLGIVLGWSAKAVDILARRCNLDGFVWPDGDLDSLGLADVVDDNFLYAEVSAALVSSLIHGAVFAVNTQGGDDEPDSLVHFKDAMNATGDWNSRTRRMDNLLSITGRDDEGNPTGLALYLDGETVTANKDGGKWSFDRTDHGFGLPVEALVYKPRVGRPMGSSRISRAVMSLHDQALRTVIRMEGHMDVYSFPEMWMLGADPSVFKNADGTVKPVWQTMIARIKGIPDDEDAPENLARADVKQFPAASPQPHLDALRQQAELFSGETSIPLSSLGVSNKGNPTSADSYIASREDLIAEAEGATDDWTPPLRRTVRRALAIANGLDTVPDAWKTIDAKWRSPIYLSRAAQADAGSKQLTAVPWLAETSIGLKLLGLDQQDIDIAMSEKRRAGAQQLMQRLVSGNGGISTGTQVPTEPAAPVSGG
jgi:hypothetical protein